MTRPQETTSTTTAENRKVVEDTTATRVGTGIGVAGGAAAGAAAGMLGGPVTAAVGAVVGAAVGGFTGNKIAEAIDPSAEDAYWKEHFQAEPYYSGGFGYEDYAPAYRLGYASRAEGKADWNALNTEWRERWDAERGASRLDWKAAEPAAQAAWRRAHEIWEDIERQDRLRKG